MDLGKLEGIKAEVKIAATLNDVKTALRELINELIGHEQSYVSEQVKSKRDQVKLLADEAEAEKAERLALNEE